MILAALLVVALYGSAHLLGHRFLSRSVLMWMNGTCIMAGAVLATGGSKLWFVSQIPFRVVLTGSSL